MGNRSWVFWALGIVDAVRRSALVYVYAGGVFRDTDEEPLGLFDAAKWRAGIGGHGGRPGGAWHYAECSGSAEDCAVQSDRELRAEETVI